MELGHISLEEYLKRCCNKQQIETIIRLAEISGNKLELIKNPKQQKLIKDIIDNALQTVDSEKINVLLQIYNGAINCEDDSIEKLPIEQIVRIIRDISCTELLFLKRYNESVDFMVVPETRSIAKVDSEDSYTHFVVENSDEAQDFWGLVNMGLLYTMPGCSAEFKFTKLGRNLIDTIKLLKSHETGNLGVDKE